MSLPISTPPNAIAFATGSVTTKEMAKVGTLISFAGMLVMLGYLILLNAWGYSELGKYDYFIIVDEKTVSSTGRQSMRGSL